VTLSHRFLDVIREKYLGVLIDTGEIVVFKAIFLGVKLKPCEKTGKQMLEIRAKYSYAP
jgi:hypothetical protein